MKTSSQEIIIYHSAKDLYFTVLDIEKYPEFIPWCKELTVQTKTKDKIIADMVVQYKFFLPQKFTSHVFYNDSRLKIKTKYINGPLKDLNTIWEFKKIENKKTKVLFLIEFEFKNLIHQKIAELFYSLLENKMIDSFKKRADEILN